MSQQLVRQRKPSFLDYSLRLDGITDILQIVSNEPRYFTQVLNQSRIKFKKSFLKYLNYCKEKDLVESYQTTITASRGRGRGITKHGHVTFYHITDKGRKFLELVQ